MSTQRFQFPEEQLKIMQESCIPFAIYQFIDKRVVTLVHSHAHGEMFGTLGISYEESLKRMDSDIYCDTHPSDTARVAEAAVRFALHDDPYDIIYRSKRPDSDEYMIIHAVGRHIEPEPGVRLAVVWYTNEGDYTKNTAQFPVDLTELNEIFGRLMENDQLVRKSLYDPLTGLPNMGYFNELATAGRAKIRRQGDQAALMFFDLSGMKSYNRRFGFAEGNKLIRAVAKMLVKHFTAENCARFGADHFAVYTPYVDLEKKLRQIFDENTQLNGGHSLPMRVGIYLDHFDEVEVSTAFDRAKMACDLNRKTYISMFEYFDENLLNISVNQSYILENLDTALREKWIKVFYQPIVRMTNGKVCDEEALARWIDPVRGFLSPAEFIPILESAHLIYKLDLYMVDQILAHMKHKEKNGLSVVPVSVNLSRSDFDVCDIVEEICRRVDDAGIPRAMLNVEITESVIGRDYEYMKQQVERFQSLGFRVWMDDFGTGYSALDVLQKFDFDLIKFDMSFIQQYYDSKKSQIILTELMHMVVKLGIDTVAEGVETEDHIRFLREIGCDKIQGFFYSKPVPLDVILEWYRQELAIELENMQESDYYTTVGKLNLNDPTIIDHRSYDDTESQYLSRVPMSIVEMQDDAFTIIRCNKIYEEFLNRCFGVPLPIADIRTVELPWKPTQDFIDATKECIQTKEWVALKDELPDYTIVKSFIRPVTVNPVTGATALLVVVLSVSNKER